MVVTLFGMVIEVRLLHLKKAELPIVVTLFGMVIEVSPEQLEYLQNALYQQFAL